MGGSSGTFFLSIFNAGDTSFFRYFFGLASVPRTLNSGTAKLAFGRATI